MNSQEQTRHIRRILAGEIHCVFNGKRTILKQPSPEILSASECLYADILYSASFLCIKEEDLLVKMIENGFWSEEEDTKLKGYKAHIEAIKVEAWHAYTKFSQKRVKRCKKQVRKIQRDWTALYSKRHMFDCYLAEGVARVGKNEFLVASLVDEQLDYVDIANLVRVYYEDQLSEEDLRGIAKSSQMRYMWNCANKDEFIGKPISYWTDEQIGLVSWSKMYDNINESPDCPPSEVVEDDVLIDGWLIEESKKRNKEKQARVGGGFVNSSNKSKPGIQEVYIPAETQEDATRINDMNDAQVRFEKRQREKLIVQHGAVEEQKMPDSQLVMRQQALQEIMNRSKQRR